nr:unnamed protein product [Digitaria exilis]
MEAAAKPARAGGGSAPDRLSALPDELLRHVLSFLRSRQAVQTTVLSKRWVDLWRSVPAIDLDVTDFPENNSSIYVNWGKMKDFSTKLLMFHSAQFLDAVRLRLGIFDSRNHLRDDVDVWVRCLIKHQPLVLDITVSRSFGLRFQIPLVDSPFRRLKTLELYGVFVDHGFKERLNSGCPVKPVVGPIELPMLENLRTLFLDSCVLCDNFRILRYFLQRSPNLEKLTVRYCRFPKGADGGKRMPNSTKTRFRFWNLVRFQCHKLKSTEIIYKKGGKIKELVSFLRTFQRTHQ